ncbi:IS3 family transposase [Kocuria rosea]|uniref:IS3 family transposase n=1 Tax=Kocuria rosea TaxID=1275 RepID=UPI0034D2DAB6
MIRRRDPWKTINDLELALAEYIDSFSHQRLHGEIWPVAPAEYANTHYRHHAAQRPP